MRNAERRKLADLVEFLIPERNMQSGGSLLGRVSELSWIDEWLWRFAPTSIHISFPPKKPGNFSKRHHHITTRDHEVRFADAHSGSTRRRIMPEPSSSSPSSSSSIKVLATTHALVFLAGVVAGRSLNADELAAYRAAQYEDRGRQLKRAAAKVALGVAACSIAMIGLRVKRASS